MPADSKHLHCHGSDQHHSKVSHNFFTHPEINSFPFFAVCHDLFVEECKSPLAAVLRGRVGKGISAQASHKTVLEIFTSQGFSHSA